MPTTPPRCLVGLAHDGFTPAILPWISSLHHTSHHNCAGRDLYGAMMISVAVVEGALLWKSCCTDRHHSHREVGLAHETKVVVHGDGSWIYMEM